MTVHDLRRATDNFSGLGHEAKVLNDLYETSENEALRAVTQIVFRHNAAAAAAELEVVLSGATDDLKSLALTRDRARAEVRTIGADLEAAEKELEAVGRPGQAGHRERELSQEKSRVTELRRDHQEAGKALRAAVREHGAVEKRAGGMKKVLTALRSVHPPDREIMRALADALNGVG